MKNKLISLVEKMSLKPEIPKFEIGDTVDVHQRILEGQKERIQIFSGVVIARRGGGMRETFTVRRIVQGEGVERVFPIHSPKIAKVEVKKTGRVRRAKLYYLRGRVGKATRLRERKAKPLDGQVPGTTAEDDPARPAESVDQDKQRRLTDLALDYLRRHRLLDYSARFDVLAIAWPPGRREPRIDHHRQAFEAVGRYQMHS